MHFQIFFQFIAEEKEHPGDAYERTGRMKALCSWERDSLEESTLQRLWSVVL